MSRPCSVCTSADRDAIDIALASGRSQRSVATQYGRSEAAVRRHAQAHLRPGLARVARSREDVRFAGLLARMGSLVEAGERLLADSTRAGGDPRVTLAAIREIRETLTAIGKLATSEQAMAEQEEAIADLMRALARVLPKHPQVTAELAAELRKLGDEDFSAALDELAQKASAPQRLAR